MSPDPGQPNILLITTDQQRYDSCGPAQREPVQTPHFDILAREGVTFARAYSNAPICVASRVSTMTGLYAQTHGELANGASSAVMGHEQTIPGRLGRAAYQTCAIGKMHWGPQRVRHGFGEMIILQDYYDEMDRLGPGIQPMGTGLDQNELYAGMATVPEGLSITNWIAEQSSRYIRDRRDPTRPFFLWCSFSKPHPPLDPPEPYCSMYADCDLGAPLRAAWSEPGRAPVPFERTRQTWSADRVSDFSLARARAAYYGLVTQVDYNMGKVFAALSDAGLYDDTLIIYTSDHGEMLGDHRALGKVFAYESSAHVPFLVRLPRSWARRRAGEVDSALVTHADILPTLLDAATGTAPEGLDGRSLLPLVRGEDPQEPRQHLEITCSCWEALAPGQKRNEAAFTAATDGRYKYIWYPEGAREQLFDLAEDPGELADLCMEDGIGQEAVLARDRLRRWLLEAHRSRGSSWVERGEFVRRPVGEDTEKERRARRYPTFSSTRTPHGGRH